MIKPLGYIFTIIHLAGVFFPSFFRGSAEEIPRIFGHLAFSLFALLLARGARRTTNHFLYFVRLLVTAFATEAILYGAGLKFGIYFPDRNPLFTYASSLALIAGLSMAIGCYHDLVAQAIPAGGQLDKKILFGVPVSPGNYKIAPAAGILLGLATAGLSLFLVLHFRFAYGLFGLFYILLAFIAMRDAPEPQRAIVRGSLFKTGKSCLRTLLYLTGLAGANLLLSFFVKFSGVWSPLASLAALTAIPLAALLPEGRPYPPALRWLPYAALPAVCGIFSLLRFLF